jgi:hypothetical protein
MATSKNPGKVRIVPIKGKPGLYTFENIVRNPKVENKIVDKIMRNAKNYRNRMLAQIGM